MLNTLRRIFTVAVVLTLVTSNAAVCAGWMPTPEARMACCAAGGGCPMHKGDSPTSRQSQAMTQAQADNCCASSEDGNSSESSPSLVPSITPAVLDASVILPAVCPTLMLSDGWRTSAPIPTSPVPKHVLLSVFLV